jgi:putative intracellular protease/amidase
MKARFAVCLPIAVVLLIVPGPVSGAQDAPEEETKKQGPITVGVVLYPGFEVLDVFGPVEMFLNVGPQRLKVVMIAEKAGPVASGTVADPPGQFTGPKVYAEYGFADAPHVDILMVPGGAGTLRELNNPALMDFLRERSPKADLTTSVCSGSALLAKAGLLNQRKATSNKAFYTMLTANGPNVQWVPKARWVEDGNMITSSGVSAGIDMALAVIARLFGPETAESIAQGTEYVWNRDPGNDPFAIK